MNIFSYEDYKGTPEVDKFFQDYKDILPKYPHSNNQRAKTRVEKELFLKRLLDIWESNNDLRFGQLIINAFRDPYYTEDLFFIDMLEKHYENE